MSKSLKFIWIDDDPERATDASNLEDHLGIPCPFVDVQSNNEAIKELLAGEEPDLIIIDHNLIENNSGDFRKGSTVAAFIRETWNECPIVCVTGEDLKTVDSNQRAQYEEVIPATKISNFYSAIESIGESFKKLKAKRPEQPDEILHFLLAPENEYDRLKAIIPKELKEDFSNKSMLLDLCHWVRKILIRRPGFLYNKLWLSTLIGINVDSFDKVRGHFDAAKYKGIFADQENERWWKSSVLTILSEIVPSRGLPWEKGRKIPGLNESDYSKCYSSQEDYPETVAFIDAAENAQAAPMKLKYTVPHPNYEGLLFFDEIRMMKPAE